MISTVNRQGERGEEGKKSRGRERTGFLKTQGLAQKKCQISTLEYSTLAKVSRRNRGPMRIHKVFLDVKEPFKVTSRSFLADSPSTVKPILEEIDFYHTVKRDKKIRRTTPDAEVRANARDPLWNRNGARDASNRTFRER